MTPLLSKKKNFKILLKKWSFKLHQVNICDLHTLLDCLKYGFIAI